MSDVLRTRLVTDYRRHPFDYYREDAGCVHKLLDAVTFDGAIHDPACGAGNIPRTAAGRGYAATGSDIVDRGFGTVIDFLEDRSPRCNIVSNPPYVLAERFVLHALSIVENRVAVLVRLAFLEGQGRRKRLYLPHPPEQVLVFATRPSMPPGDLQIEATGGKVAYAWVVWLKGWASRKSTIGWLP
jgi:hypothetical protein